MSLRVIFLGTAGSVPTPKRSLSAVLVKRKGERMMFDCGEGVQRQMIIARVGFGRLTKIFISHMHGDHLLGLPGLLQTMTLLDRKNELHVYGPPSIGEFIESIRKTVQCTLGFPVNVHEIEKSGIVCREEEYAVRAIRTSHTVPNLAYAIVEEKRPGRFNPSKARALGVPEGPLWSKIQRGETVLLPNGRTVMPEQILGPWRDGRKIVYTGDMKPFTGFVSFASNADLLIHDATLADDLAERAEKEGHSTPSQAAENARRANAKLLILTHISARYEKTNVLLEQARKIFKNVNVAKDFMEVEVPFPSQTGFSDEA